MQIIFPCLLKLFCLFHTHTHTPYKHICFLSCSNKISPASNNNCGKSHSELSVGEISLRGTNNNSPSPITPSLSHFHNNSNGNQHPTAEDRLGGHIPDTIMEEDQQQNGGPGDSTTKIIADADVSSSSASSTFRDSLTPCCCNNHLQQHQQHDRVNFSSNNLNCNSNASSPTRSVKNFHTSVPNLRSTATTTANCCCRHQQTKKASNDIVTNNTSSGKPPLPNQPPSSTCTTPKSRVTRSCSHGKTSFFSFFLISKQFYCYNFEIATSD